MMKGRVNHTEKSQRWWIAVSLIEKVSESVLNTFRTAHSELVLTHNEHVC